MESSTKRRLALGFLSNWVSKLAATVIQLIQVPVFLHFWSVPLYGEWMIVNSIPAYLSFSNIGFGSVAANEMSMLSSAGDRQGALRVFQSCWWLIVCICGLTALLLAPALYLLPVAELLKLHTIGSTDTKWIIFYLGLSVLLGQLEQLLQSAYTCIGRYPYGSFIKSTISLLSFAAMMVPVILGHGARTTALVFAIANTLGTIFLCILVLHDIPWIEYGWKHASFAEIRRLTGPAIAFMGFPIGNALNLQGTLLAVGYALGPADVVIFSTARTVSRVALQMVQMVNSTFWPEMSLAFGAKNHDLTRTLHRRACQMALIIAVVVVVAMMTIGPWFLSHWTGGHVPPSRGLLAILLLVVVFYALWSTSSTLVAAINQHQMLAAYYIVGTSITCVLCYFLARSYGLYGAAFSLLASELIMNIYVLPASLTIARDTFPAFLASMLHYPPSLNPSLLLTRLRRSKPSLES
jgi:O-antigen/teichoic acid export membrane protein